MNNESGYYNNASDSSDGEYFSSRSERQTEWDERSGHETLSPGHHSLDFSDLPQSPVLTPTSSLNDRTERADRPLISFEPDELMSHQEATPSTPSDLDQDLPTRSPGDR